MGSGARAVAALDGVRILASPAGQVFCLVTDDEPRPVGPREPGPAPGRAVTAAGFAQVCLDVPPAAYDAELAFWTGATGWTPSPSALPEFTHLVPPPGGPLQLLVQRLARPERRGRGASGPRSDDIPAEVDRLLALGAVGRRCRGTAGTSLRDPVLGLPFCVTASSRRDRDQDQ